MFDTLLKPANVDRIQGFSHKDDTILLDDAIFSRIGPKPTAGAFFKGAAAHDADDRITYDPNTGAPTYGQNGDKAGGAVRIAVLDKHLALDRADFLIIRPGRAAIVGPVKHFESMV